jgi:hypothetical protein
MVMQCQEMDARQHAKLRMDILAHQAFLAHAIQFAEMDLLLGLKYVTMLMLMLVVQQIAWV